MPDVREEEGGGPRNMLGGRLRQLHVGQLFTLRLRPLGGGLNLTKVFLARVFQTFLVSLPPSSETP